MDTQAIFWIVLIVIAFGVIALLAIYKFGHSLFGRFFAREWPDFFMHYRHGPQPLPARSVVDLITDFRERRNDFWLAYGQIVIALIIAVLLTVLLLTKTISAEAGLPILSAISGFAIAKGTTAARVRAPDDTPDRG
ncbi:hypothetical protein H9L17_04845 [Thermomonas brevis]|nr:hypothetical protein [Thermomonas brevis]QNN47468.1 hypothetical protein H9L17_04845 [Thermomonas brevis]